MRIHTTASTVNISTPLLSLLAKEVFDNENLKTVTDSVCTSVSCGSAVISLEEAYDRLYVVQAKPERP